MVGTISHQPFNTHDPSHESGADFVVEWRIQDFSTLSQNDGIEYESPAFSFGGEIWFLGIYPNGASRRGTSGHVDLRLHKCYSGRSINVSFSLSLKTAEGERYKEEHSTKDFNDDGDNRFHIFKRFIPRTELTTLRSDLLPDDVLTVLCTMKKRSTSAGSDSDSASAEISTPASDSAACSSDSGECRHCRGNFAAGILSSHRRNCNQRPVKCPDCQEVVVLQKFLNDHECHHDRPEDEQNGLNFANQYIPSIPPTIPTDFQNIKYFVKKMNAGNIPEHAYVGASSQHVVASTQRVEAYAQTEEVSTQTVEEKCASFASGASTSFQEKKALQDYKQLFLEKQECDVIIKVGGSEFPAHRLILKARSPVLASTFRHDMKENATGILEIDDCDPSSFSDFLCFLYCADVQLICQSNVFDLFTLADKYQVLDLRSTCLEFVKSNLTIDTFCESIVLALRHSETELIQLCTDYFKKNAPKIIVTVKWQTFLAENPTESNELFIKLLVPNSS